jgi:iron complex outermembrane receptor protein
MNIFSSLAYKSIICTFLFLIFTNKLQAQKLQISGKVSDYESTEALMGAIISIDNNNVSATDNTGSFSFYYSPNKQVEKVKLQVMYLGYDTYSDSLLIGNRSGLNLNIKLKTGKTQLDQVIVSAGRYEQSVKKVTVSTEVIKPYLIENRITTNMDKLVDQIPSVNVVDGQVSIRSGSGWSYGAGSRVMVLLDGIPFLSGDGGQPQWKFLPIENVEQVEVIKGASSVLYGSSALNGMINFRTKLASDKPITNINLFSGVYDNAPRKDLQWSNVPKLQNGFNIFHSNKYKNMAYGIGLNYFKDDGYRWGENDHRLRISFNTRFNSKKIPSLQYGVNGSVLTTDAASFLLWESYKYGYIAGDTLITKTTSYNHSFDPFVSFFTGKLKHNFKGRWVYVDNRVNNPDPSVNQNNANHTIYSEYQSQLNLSKVFLLNAGLVWQHTISNSPLFQGNQNASNYAGFAQLDYNHKRWSANAGMRYETYSINGNSESKPVFRTGLNFEAAKATFIRASFGQGYRFPTIAEMFISTTAGSITVVPNPNLKSESGWNAEIGLKQGFKIKGFKGFIDAAYFFTQYQNMMEFNFGLFKTDKDNNGIVSFKSLNVGETRITGAEISISGEGKIGEVLIQSILGYTYTNPISLQPDLVYASDLGSSYPRSYKNSSSDTSNNLLKYRFQHLAKLDVQATYKKWSLGLSSRYNSFMSNIDLVFTAFNFSDMNDARHMGKEGDLIFDARSSYKINQKLTANLMVSNLLNREVMTRPADLRPPRLFVLQLQIKL